MARMISTSTYTAPSQAATIKALQQRAEEHASAAAKAAQMRQIGSPWQGAAQLMEVFSNNFNAGRAERAEAEGRQKLAEIRAGINYETGATPEQIQQMEMLDPEQGTLYAADAMKVLRDRQAAAATRQREDQLALQKHNQALELEREKARLAGEAPPKFTDISGARQDVISDPSYKNLAQATPIWSSITDAASRNTPQSDLNIIIGMAKLFDPTSVVREGETETVRQTANLPDNVWAQWQYLTANPNSRLSDDVKFGLLEEGASRMRGYQDAYKQTSDFYTNLAKRHRIAPEDIVPQFNVPTWQRPADPATMPQAGGPAVGGVSMEGPPMPIPDDPSTLTPGRTYIDENGRVATYKGGDPHVGASWSSQPGRPR